jgi:hypothetical protein
MGNPPKKMQNVALKKRPFKKKQYKSTIPTAPSNNTTLKMRYTDNIKLTSTLGSLASYIWRINDLYDPNFTGTGHQPYFRDQMFGLYQYAKVLWASIKISVITDTAQVPVHIILSPIQSGSADSDFNTASERKGSKEVYTNGQSMKTLYVQSTCDYYFGQKKGSTLTDTNYLQSSTSSLTANNVMWYEILYRAIPLTTQDIYIKVDIDMITRFEQPLQQSGS